MNLTPSKTCGFSLPSPNWRGESDWNRRRGEVGLKKTDQLLIKVIK
jgi:hypothetical protein